jgi:CDP-paratose 2-epimerase
MEHVAGGVYNIGGGCANAISLLDLISYLEHRLGRRLDWRYQLWRPGDQKVYISDIRRSAAELEWIPRTSWRDGVGLLCDWVGANEVVLA